MYKLPAEWAPQESILLTWPHAQSAWASDLSHVEKTFIAISQAISQRQKLVIACFDDALRAHIIKCLTAHQANLDNIDFICIKTNDTWVRDYGPISVYQHRQRYCLDFTFNAWGNKFAFDLDNAYTQQLCQANQHYSYQNQLDFVLEGGSIEINDAGCLLSTRACLLNPNRNPGLTQAEIETYLKPLLGVKKFHWLHHGVLEGDDTDSHIDMLARFCDDNTLCYTACDDTADSHYSELQNMANELKQLRNIDNAPYQCIALPWPKAKYDADGKRMPASYCNFLIINDAVLVPTYDDAADAKALAQLQQCFPTRDIIGIDCLPLIREGGSLHCSTMQIPAAKK